ncbi:bacterioferritin [Rhizomicrobium electricum]|uniref:Bacterioferritin n=1 Tax=Rhizomicrobium electricum TaxID=480070 RepID=A0ABN1E270_9PROT|nr:bacterioferritin [Rhizomicrobium electricum]NIJ47477.1 bacterioferritin [Rhizomicrobium electricum]
MSGNDRDHAASPAGTGAGTGAASGGIGPSPTASLAGDAEVIRLLNVALKNELTAINQYFLHSRMLADWGVSILAHKEYEESVDEMKHADRLIKRVLFLGGLPNLQDLGKLKIGENVREILDCDLALEMDALGTLKAGIAHSESIGDYVSRELFNAILESEEEHIDFLQIQMRLIEQIGIENYIQLQSKPHGS